MNHKHSKVKIYVDRLYFSYGSLLYREGDYIFFNSDWAQNSSSSFYSYRFRMSYYKRLRSYSLGY